MGACFSDAWFSLWGLASGLGVPGFGSSVGFRVQSLEFRVSKVEGCGRAGPVPHLEKILGMVPSRLL